MPEVPSSVDAVAPVIVAVATCTDGAQAEEASEEQHQAKPPLYEQLHWAVLGLGCTWFLGDSTALEIPWWADSQADGLKVGDRIAFAGTFALLSVPFMLLFRACFRKTYMEVAVPAIVMLSLTAGYILGFGLWKVSSSFIYASVLISQTVGTLVPFGILPHMMYKNYKTALISSLYFGGSLSSMSASLLSMVQSPGDQRRFSPSLFFLIITTPILASLVAYWRISSKSIGVVTASSYQAQTLILSDIAQGEGSLGRVRRGTRNVCRKDIQRLFVSVFPFAMTSCLMTLGSFTLLRSALTFATTNTVHGHSLCHPHCSEFCAMLTNLGKDACDSHGACQSQFRTSAQGFVCIEHRGEKWLGWSVSLAQFSSACGIGATVIYPSFRLYFCTLLWLFPTLMILVMARLGDGTLETSWSGPTVVGCLFLARVCQGYFEVMQWRYLAYRYKEFQEIATTILAVVLMIVCFFGGLVVALGVEYLQVFKD